MEKYKNEALQRKIEGLEYSQIQKEVILNKRIVNKKRYKKPVLFFLMATFFMLMSIGTNQSNENGFSIVKVNANEYIINSFDDGLLFKIYTLVENDKIVFNDKYSYFKDMESHIDISDRTEIIAHEINEFNILEVLIDNKDAIYFEVVERENYRWIGELDYDFNDFLFEMTELSKLLNKYPPVKRISNSSEYHIVHKYEYNPNIESYNDDEVINLYKWYVDRMKYFYDTRMVEYEIKSFELLIYMEGSVEESGSIDRTINSINGTYNNKYSTSPLLVNGDELEGVVSTPIIDEDSSIMMRHYLSLSKNYNEKAYSTVILDFSDSIYDIADVDVNIMIGNKRVDIDKMLYVNKILYVFPQVELANEKGEIYVSTEVKISKNNKNIFSYEDIFIFGYTPK